MRKISRTQKTLLVCLTLGIGVTSVLAARQHRPGNSLTPHALPASTTVVFPAATGNSATDKQIAELAAKLQAEPSRAVNWVNLGDARMQKARETGDADYYTQAEQAYQKALQIEPKQEEAANGMAWVESCRHEFEKSIDWAHKAIALNPGDPLPYGLLGDAAVEMGNYDLAYDQYQKMLDLRPDISSYSRGAHLLNLVGDIRKSAWLMGKAIEAGAPYAENTAWCRAQLALILFNDGAYPVAEQVLAPALKYAPNNYWVLYTMGKVKSGERDYPVAIDYFKRAVAVIPQHDALVALGDLYSLTGKPQAAEQQYRLVEAIHTLNKAKGVQGDLQIAQFYADHDRNLKEALQEAQAEYTARPTIFAADTLAWCYYKNGQLDDAARYSQKALSKHTPDARLLFHAGMIAAKQQDRVTAQNTLYRALSLNPNFNPVDAPVAQATLTQLGSHATVSVAEKR